MLTLAQAFRLCGVGEETVFLKTPEQEHSILDPSYPAWSKKIRDTLDMKKIVVYRISPRFEHFGPEFLGWCFHVKGADLDMLRKISLF